MKNMKIVCCQPERINDIVKKGKQYYRYDHITRDVNGSLVLVIYDEDDRFCLETITFKEIDQDVIDRLNQDEEGYYASSRFNAELLKMIGIKKLKISIYIDDEIRTEVIIDRLFMDENKHLFNKKNVGKFLSHPEVFSMLDRSIIDNKLLEDLFGDLKIYFTNLLSNRKVTNSSRFVSQFYRTFLEEDKRYGLSFLMDEETSKEFFKYTLDQRNNGKYLKPCLRVCDNFKNYYLLDFINWNEYIGTKALEKAERKFMDLIAKIQKEKEDGISEESLIIKRYNLYIHKIINPIAFIAESSITFLSMLDDREFEVVSKQIKGNLYNFVNAIYKKNLNQYLLDEERTKDFLQLLLDEADLISKKERRENYIKRVLIIMNNLKKEFDEEIDLDYSKSIKSFIVKNSLSNK